MSGISSEQTVRRKKIEVLHPSSMNVIVVGVILGKSEIRGLASRKKFGTERFTFGFVLRDSPSYFIFVECWGTEDYIRNLADNFKIGDAVQVENPLVRTKDMESDERYKPCTPSPYKLVISENHSAVELYTGSDIKQLFPLQHLPTKESHDFYTLSDIMVNGQNLNNEVINILAVIRMVSVPKAFVTKDNRQGSRCEVTLFDDTTAAFSLILWDKEMITLAQSWAARETVIFAADVRVSFDRFRQTMVATAISRTIITTNPNTHEAQVLFTYAKDYYSSATAEDELLMKSNQEDLLSIKDICTIEQLKEKQTSLQTSEPQLPMCAITFAFLTSFNIDDDSRKVTTLRCSQCNTTVDQDIGVCSNQNCNSALLNEGNVVTMFDLRVDFSDHTGTLKGCWVSHLSAEKMLGCTVEEFTCMTDSQKTEIKWKLLLERCKVYVKMNLSMLNNTVVRVKVLSCELADPEEMLKCLL
uniref:Meiosis-specific with OB domain-containing protein n=1 Tax=Eptatretus burgeri TaxID=7764 RepID=A0A8C4Q7G2_EPTBU